MGTKSGSETRHALRLKPDHPIGAGQGRGRYPQWLIARMAEGYSNRPLKKSLVKALSSTWWMPATPTFTQLDERAQKARLLRYRRSGHRVFQRPAKESFRVSD